MRLAGVDRGNSNGDGGYASSPENVGGKRCAVKNDPGIMTLKCALQPMAEPALQVSKKQRTNGNDFVGAERQS